MASLLMNEVKRIALVAHDHKKRDLLQWALRHRAQLAKHSLYATGSTGAMLKRGLRLPVMTLESGPLGGDQQVGAHIADGEIDFLIFFWDPLEPQSHDPDVKALLRMGAVWNIPIAGNEATADFLFSSPLMDREYTRRVPNYTAYRRRRTRET